ncbi:MAG: TonB-dependent receptor [Paludibacter sp.]|nr:TonB-dependent receptor [Paludibacter sp.]
MKKNTILLLALCINFILVNAQTINLSGSVVSATDKEPLIGVSVLIKGTTVGTITDIDGKYKLPVTKSNAILVISYIGYKTTEIAVGNQSNINVVLKEDTKVLDEVIAIGYGSTKKADLTSAISTLNPKEVLKMPGSVTEALQGSIAGVQITAGKIRIRGVGSITGGTDPLWVVDGLIGGHVPNENEIETIQVLKDAASCAIYGLQGSNGVIIVTTKKGTKGKTTVEYSANLGTGYPWKTLDMLNAFDYGVYVNELYYNYHGPANYRANVPTNSLEPTKPLADTNWQDAWFRNSFYQKHNLSVSGGTESFTFRSGVSYGSDKGTVINEGGESKSIYGNFQLKKGKVTFGQNFIGSQNSNYYGSGEYADLLRQPSNIPVYDETTASGFYVTGNGPADGNDMINQIALKNLIKNKNNSMNLKGSVWAEIQIIPSLKFKTSYGFDLYSANSYNYTPVYNIGKGVNEQADLSEGSNRNQHYVIDNMLTFDKKFGKHSISALVGTSSETNYNRTFNASGEREISTELLTMNHYALNPSIGGTEGQEALYSWLARAMYSYNDRYMITANIRRDKTSRFSPDNRVGYFPSFSAGWRVSEENFMKEVKWISNLKLRATYGTIGNRNIGGYYTYQSAITTANLYYTLGADQTSDASNALAPLVLNISNPDLTWETTRDAGFGFDLDLFKNKVNVVFDYYNRRTTDMLLNMPLPLSSGTTRGLDVNRGIMSNQGVELSVNYRDKIGDFSFSISPNVSINRNNIVDLVGSEFKKGDLRDGGQATLTKEGSSVGRFYGYQTAGLFRSVDEVNAYVKDGVKIQPNAAPGDVKFIDRNENGSIDEGDKTFIGSPIPDATFGLVVSADYKGFDFSMMWQGDMGNEIYNNGISYLENSAAAINQTTRILDRFRLNDVTLTTPAGESLFLPANTDGKFPRAILSDPNGNFTKISDLFIEDGSYIRCKRVTLGYTLAESIVKQLKISKFRAYIGMKNPLTFTKYSLFDPEVPGMNFNNLERGIDMQQNWSSINAVKREFFAGVELTF